MGHVRWVLLMTALGAMLSCGSDDDDEGGSGGSGATAGGSGGGTGGASSGGTSGSGQAGTAAEAGAPGGGECGPIGQACNGSCAAGYECLQEVCVPAARPICGGFAGADCPDTSSRCMYCSSCDYGPCLSADEAACLCGTAAGRAAYPDCTR